MTADVANVVAVPATSAPSLATPIIGRIVAAMRHFGVAFALLTAWQISVDAYEVPALILPSPIRVVQELAVLLQLRAFWINFGVTLVEIVGGFLLGSLLGLALGAAAALSPKLGQILNPYIVTSQALPKLAIAPLLVVWLGFGLSSKIVLAALVSFYPLFENTVLGLRSAESVQLELFRTLRASPWQRFSKLMLPVAIPFIGTGLRIALVLSIVGAVVAEFVGANYGLGTMLISAQGVLNTPIMFAIIVVLTLLSLFLYGLVVAVERRMRRWRYGN